MISAQASRDREMIALSPAGGDAHVPFGQPRLTTGYEYRQCPGHRQGNLPSASHPRLWRHKVSGIADRKAIDRWANEGGVMR